MAGTSYTRQSTLTDGDTITAALFNDEYNKLVSAFAYTTTGTTGHQHDGGSAEGGNIHTIGDQDFLNKIVVDSTNNRWGVFVQVSGSAVEQIRIQDGAIVPVTDSDIDLGTSSLEFKDGYFDGTIHVDTLDVDANATVAGTLAVTGNTTVGGTLVVTGTTTLNGGTLTLGDAASDNVVFGADVNSNIIPNTDSAFDLGSSSQEWRDLYLDGTAHIDTLDVDVNATVAGTLGVTGVATVGGLTIGSAVITEAELETIDTITAGTVVASKAVVVDSNKDIASFRNVTLTGELDAATGDFSGAVDIDGALDVAGTTNLDVVDIDGAVDMATTLAVAGNVDFNGDLDVDGTTNLDVVDIDGAVDMASTLAVAGVLTAASLDISGDVDVDGTLETDALTIAGVTLAETIADTVGAMVSSNTESGITVAYQDADNTLDFTVGTLNQDTTGTAAIATTVTITDNESTNENNAIVFTAGGDLDGGNLGLESDGDLKYNPSTGTLSATNISVSGTLSTVDSVTMSANNAVVFEGATADAHETTLTSVDATADRTITLPNVSGTVPVLAVASNTQITSTPEELNALDGITAVVGELNALDIGSTAVGTAVASKAVILDSNKDYTGIRNLTITGELDAATLDVSGAIDVAGTTNLDVVDIDGAVDMASTLAVAGVVTANAGVVVDNFTLDGTTLALSSGDMLVDVAGNITLDADDNGEIRLKDGGTQYGALKIDSSRFKIQSIISDADMLFAVNDGGSEVTALALDASAAGAATFNSSVRATQLEAYKTNHGGDVSVAANQLGNAYENLASTASLILGATSTTLANSSKIVSDHTAASGGGTNNHTQSLSFHPVGSNSQNFEAFRIASDGSLSTPTAGTSNVRFGVNAGNSIASGGNYNTVVGDEAGTAISTGDENTAVGYNALVASTTAGFNTAVGASALLSNTSGQHNSALGREALKTNTEGAFNTAVGRTALAANTTASYNTSVGYNSLAANTEGTENTALGQAALDANTTASFNTAIGSGAMSTNILGARNTALGRDALFAMNPASAADMYNVAVGFGAGAAVTTGIENTLIGGLAGDAITVGEYNIALGARALGADTKGSQNVAIGAYALTTQNFTSATAAHNVAVGTNVGRLITTGIENTLIGGLAGDALTDADYNVAVGASALTTNVLGHVSVAIGHSALKLQNPASAANMYNVAVGHGSGSNITTGVQNILVGGLAGLFATTTDGSTFVGAEAGQGITGTKLTGNHNTAIGQKAGLLLQGAATNNTLVGATSGDGITTGNANTALGGSSLTGVTTGSNNVGLGEGAGYNITTGSSNIIIGKDITAASATADGQIHIGTFIHNHGDGSLEQGNIDVSQRTSDTNVLAVTQGTATNILGTGNKFSGMFLINDINSTGEAALCVSGGGVLKIVEQTGSAFIVGSSPSTSQIGLYLSSLQIILKPGRSGTTNFRIISFRTRNAQ